MTVAGKIAMGSPGDTILCNICFDARDEGDPIHVNTCGKGTLVHHFQTMTQQSETRYVGKGVYFLKPCQPGSFNIEPGHLRQSRIHMFF